MSDGWEVLVDGQSFSWDHNEEDLGVGSLEALLKHLGHEVEIEEVY